MDPSQALREAEDCLRAGQPAEAAEALARYRAWRRRGGFEPPGGDGLADELRRRQGETATRQETSNDTFRR